MEIKTTLHSLLTTLDQYEQDLEISNERIQDYMTSPFYNQRQMDAMEAVNIKIIQAIAITKARIVTQESNHDTNCNVSKCKGCKVTAVEIKKVSQDQANELRSLYNEYYSDEDLTILDGFKCRFKAKKFEDIEANRYYEAVGFLVFEPGNANHSDIHDHLGFLSTEECVDIALDKIYKHFNLGSGKNLEENINMIPNDKIYDAIGLIYARDKQISIEEELKNQHIELSIEDAFTLMEQISTALLNLITNDCPLNICNNLGNASSSLGTAIEEFIEHNNKDSDLINRGLYITNILNKCKLQYSIRLTTED